MFSPARLFSKTDGDGAISFEPVDVQKRCQLFLCVADQLINWPIERIPCRERERELSAV